MVKQQNINETGRFLCKTQRNRPAMFHRLKDRLVSGILLAEKHRN